MSTTSKPRSLAPREHGAYAQLAVPLAAAYAGGHPAAAAWLFGLAAVAAFLAHEPLLVLLGQRGKRALAQSGARASGRAVGLAAVSLLAAAAGAALDRRAAVVGLVPVAFALVLAAFVVRRRERTYAGELVAAAALAGAALPVAIGAGWQVRAALAAFIGWTAGFAAVTFVVFAIAHKRTPNPASRALALFLPALAIAMADVFLGKQALATGVPLVGLAAVVVAFRPAARRLHSVGWTVAAATLAQAVAVVAVNR